MIKDIFARKRASASLLVKNCRLVYKGNVVTRHIYIEDGKIAAITKDLPGADAVLDAEDNFVIPGVIDCHVHFREPGYEKKEDFLSGSIAAAAGGVTTVLDMPDTNPPTTTLKSLDEKRSCAKKSLVNYGFHFGATLHNLQELQRAENIASVKVFMGSSTEDLLVNDDGVLFDIFSAIPLTTIHAENEDLIRSFSKKYRDENSAHIHGDVQNMLVAEEAVRRALTLKKYTENRLHFCHVSTQTELAILRAARERVSIEVTPHHLFLRENDVRHLGNYGKVNPPLRSTSDRTALWEGIKEGLVDIVASDHAPHTAEEKEQEYWLAPAGVPGVETMLPLLLEEVSNAHLSLQRVVELTAINPARIFGIQNKGLVKEGYDADLVVVDMKRKKAVVNDSIFTKCKWSPFHGRVLHGWPTATIVSGQVVFQDGTINTRARGEEVQFQQDTL